MEEQASEGLRGDECKAEERRDDDKCGTTKDAEHCLEVEDPELDALLDSSLSDFGKHVPSSSEEDPKPKPRATDDIFASSFGSMFENMRGLEEGVMPGEDDPMMKELEDVFGEEFAKQAEAQLTDAMEMLKAENPELLKQFEELAKSVGLEEEPCKDSSKRKTEPVLPDTSTGEQKDQVDHTFQSVLEDTLQRIQKSTQVPEQGAELEGLPSKLMEMMGNMDLEEGGEGEEQVMKMMEGMMKTLLSKDVLYPSLADFCKQYPEWLDRHSDSLSAEDRDRYVHQLEIMRQICKEFEKEDGGEEDTVRQERILKLMQELQKYGQPPEDLAGAPFSQMGLPTAPLFSPSQTEDQCSLM